MRWAERIERVGEMRIAYNTSIEKSDGKRQLRKTKRRWEGNIKMDLEETVWEGVDWIHLAQNKDY
jgi:hypothetical protein